MNADEFETLLRSTLDDGRISRSEQRAMREVIEDLSLDAHQRALFRDRAFRLAESAAGSGDGKRALEWFKDVVALLEPRPSDDDVPDVAEAYFSPGETCRERIRGLLAGARRSVDICVFTITDNRLSEAILDAHHRRVRVRVISDDEKAGDRGSDSLSLRGEGVEVVLDPDPSHMHHKFAIFDGDLLLTGSYNWTRSAATENRDNVLVTSDARLVRAFSKEFERLWELFTSR